MIQIVGKKLTQWDVDRVVQVNGDVSHVHFANQGDSQAPIIEVVAGEAKIPNYLLQTGKTLLVYAVKNGRTIDCKAFAVRKRERPENYIYEDDQRNYIYALIDEVNAAIDNANKAADELREAIENGEIDVTGTVKTVNGIGPDENGNVEIEVVGGAATPYFVDVYFLENEPDINDFHWKDLQDEISNERMIVCRVNKGNDLFYLPMTNVNDYDELVTFSADIEYNHHEVSILNDGTVVYKCENRIGDISTALDHIIELQEELIGL